MPPKKRMKRDFSNRGWKNRRQQGKKDRGRKESKDEGSTQSRGAGYKDIVKENELFVKYYQGLGFIPALEWDTFMAVMREPLPATFRITGTRLTAEHVRTCLQRKFFGQLAEMEVEGEKVPPAKPISWYPNDLAWHVPLTRKFIRKSPLMSKFHSFLVKESEQGNISRQETVSMIPPLLLDVQPHHKVLDMCAAPGSKTAQLIEALHAEDSSESTIPSGVVIANDADNKRCYMLVHQTKRLNSPCFMVTNHDASVFPMFYYHDESDVRHTLFYDRVLCDVPCSGDGTLRKNPTIWREWKPSVGQSLHKLQLRILTRGLELLTPGGRLVYSTCSLNPVENEAVIATMIKLCKGCVELVDCADSLPGLQRLSGLTSWKIMNKKGEWFSSFSEVPESSTTQLPSTLFPPEPNDPVLSHLPKCIRVLPHHQDTGGFFIALLEKKEWLPWQKQRKTAKQSSEFSGDKSTLSEHSTPPTESNTALVSQNTITAPQNTGSDTNDELSQDVMISVQNKDVQATTDKAQDTTDKAQDITDNTLDTVQDTINVAQDITANTSDTVQDTIDTIQDTTDMAQETADNAQNTTDMAQETADNAQNTADSAQDTTATEGVKTPKKDEERPSRAVLGRPSFQKRRIQGFKEDPYVFLPSGSDVEQALKSYYGMPEVFPFDQLLTRSHTGKKRNIYLSSGLVKELTIRNEHVVKIINIGVRLLSRYDHHRTSITFRLCQEGVDSVLPYVTSRTIPVTQEDLVSLLAQPNPLTASLSQLAQEALKPLDIGPVLFKYYPPTEPTSDPSTSDSDRFTLTCPMSLSGWRAAMSVRLFVDKIYRYHFLSMLGEEPQENQPLECVSGAGRGVEEKDDSGREEDGADAEGASSSLEGQKSEQGGMESNFREDEVMHSDKGQRSVEGQKDEGDSDRKYGAEELLDGNCEHSRMDVDS